MYCQVCGVQNNPDDTFCRSCQQNLLVISGPFNFDEQNAFSDTSKEEPFSLDEHLLERISILEEVVRRMGEGLKRSLTTIYKLEQNLLVNETSLSTLRDLLENKGLLTREEWSEPWESRMQSRLLALEKRESFTRVKGRIAALYQGDQHRGFRRRLGEADTALLRFELDEALRALESAHRLDPGNHELSFFIAEIFFNEGNIDEAAGYFAKVLLTAPDHFESLVYSGVLCHVKNLEELAERRLQRAVAKYPEHFLPSFSLGAIYASQGRLLEAVSLLGRAVELEEVPQAVLLLGQCCYELDRPGLAITHLEAALRLDPTSIEALHLVALAFLKRGWHKKAEKALRESQALDPLRLTYGELEELLLPPTDRSRKPPGPADRKTDTGQDHTREYIAQGRFRDALGAFRRALTDDPENPETLLAYAMVCLELGRDNEVEPVVNKALALNPPERLAVGAQILRMEALRSQGKLGASTEVGRHLLEIGPSNFARAFACCQMAWNLTEENQDFSEALTVARQGHQLAPRELIPLSLAALGWVHYHRREYQASVDFLTQATKIAPNARTLIHLGMALLAAGEHQRVHQVLSQARQVEAQQRDPVREILATLQEGARLLQDAPSDAL
jgi:tetratricopeptide (TPR) repeat protein